MKGEKLAAVAVALLGVAVRCLPWRDCFRREGVVPYGVDGSYHLWRAESLAASFPALPLHDPYLSFPRGAAIPWPPGLDLLLAVPGFFGLGPGAMAAWGAVLMPLLGGLAVYLLYRLGRAVFDPLTGLAAALLLALMPGAVSDTFVGRIDHHALVAAVTLGIFLAFLACLESRPGRGSLGWGILCGLLAAAAVLGWPVSPPLFFLPVPLTLLLLRWSDRRESARRAAPFCLVLPLAFILLAVALAADLANRPFDLYQLSLFIAVPYFLAALLVPAFLAGWKRFLAASVLLLALPGLAALFAPGWFGVVREALGVAGGEDPSYLMALETLPLFTDGQAVSLSYAVRYFTYFVLLAPFFFLAFVWENVRKGSFSPPRILFAVYFFTGFGLMVFQSRFREFAAPALALLIAWALVGLGQALFAARGEGERQVRFGAWALLGGAATALALAPLATDLYEKMKIDRFAYPAKVYDFGRDFAARAARMGETGRGTEGILSSWSDSHRLLHSTRLPVMTSSFGTADAREMNARAFRILLERDEEEAVRQLRENRIRFVVVSSVFSEVEGMARMAGVEVEPFFATLHSRLYLGYGSAAEIAGHLLEPLSRFRLVAESEWAEAVLGAPRTIMAAFELVEGATIRGETAPGSPVALTLDLRTNLGRPFRYLRRTVADGGGKYEFTAPYWTVGGGATGPYRLQTAEGSVLVDVMEQQVRAGALLDAEGGGK